MRPAYRIADDGELNELCERKEFVQLAELLHTVHSQVEPLE